MKAWVHLKSGKLYHPINWNGSIQVEDEWIPAVIYVSLSGDTMTQFIRSHDEFQEKFKAMYL